MAGAALVILEEVAYKQSADLSDLGLGTQTNTSVSDADKYIIPTIGVALQVSPNLTLGMGLEADSGLGADYRDDPISLLGGADPLGNGGSQIPLDIEVISFNANLAAAYKLSQQLSVGASLTIGFGLGQLGTVGPTIIGDTLAAVTGGTVGTGGVLGPGTGPSKPITI